MTSLATAICNAPEYSLVHEPLRLPCLASTWPFVVSTAISRPCVLSLATASCEAPEYSLVHGAVRLPCLASTWPFVVSTAISGPCVLSLATASCEAPEYSLVHGAVRLSCLASTWPFVVSTAMIEGAAAILLTRNVGGCARDGGMTATVQALPSRTAKVSAAMHTALRVVTNAPRRCEDL